MELRCRSASASSLPASAPCGNSEPTSVSVGKRPPAHRGQGPAGAGQARRRSQGPRRSIDQGVWQPWGNVGCAASWRRANLEASLVTACELPYRWTTSTQVAAVEKRGNAHDQPCSSLAPPPAKGYGRRGRPQDRGISIDFPCPGRRHQDRPSDAAHGISWQLGEFAVQAVDPAAEEINAAVG